MRTSIKSALAEARRALDQLDTDEAAHAAIEAGARLIARALTSGGRVLAIGNGGSMCDAMHFAEELSGRFRRDRPALDALAASDPAHLTCAANDFGFPEVFARFVDAHGRAGDVLLAISTSGKSENILRAATAARAKGLKVISLVGREKSPLSGSIDIEICTAGPTPWSDRIQELHIKVIHLLVELVERQLFPALYKGE